MAPGATVPLEVLNSVEGCSFIIAVSIPLKKPLLVIVGQGFIELASRLGSNIWSVNRGSLVTSSGRGARYRIQGSKDNIPLQQTPIVSTASEEGRPRFHHMDHSDPPKKETHVETGISVQTQNSGVRVNMASRS